MQPYQSATEEINRQGEEPLRGAQKVGALGASAAAGFLGGGAINRVLPFLSQYIPEDLVKKGLTKVDPRYGKFIDKALAGGQTIEEAKNFIGEKIQTNAKDNRNIIQQYDPELDTYISDYIKKGVPLFEAGKKALGHGRFKNAIDKMIKDHKTSWDSILKNVYGSGQTAQPQQPLDQSTGNPGQLPQQGSPPAKQQLLQAMQALTQKLRT